MGDTEMKYNFEKLLLAYVEEIAAQSTGIPPARLKEKTREMRVVFSRWLVWDFLREYNPKLYTFHKIARDYAHNHASVIHGINVLAFRQVGWRAEAQKFFDERIEKILNY